MSNFLERHKNTPLTICSPHIVSNNIDDYENQFSAFVAQDIELIEYYVSTQLTSGRQGAVLITTIGYLKYRCTKEFADMIRAERNRIIKPIVKA